MDGVGGKVADLHRVSGPVGQIGILVPRGDAAAVLIRALEPTVGIETMRARRGKARKDRELCNGPGKLTEALGITLAQNESRLDRAPFELLAPAGDPPEVVAGPRGVG